MKSKNDEIEKLWDELPKEVVDCPICSTTLFGVYSSITEEERIRNVRIDLQRMKRYHEAGHNKMKNQIAIQLLRNDIIDVKDLAIDDTIGPFKIVEIGDTIIKVDSTREDRRYMLSYELVTELMTYMPVKRNSIMNEIERFQISGNSDYSMLIVNDRDNSHVKTTKLIPGDVVLVLNHSDL